MFLHTWHPHALLLTAGPLELRWYGLLLAVGTLVGYFTVLAVAKRSRLNTNQVTDLFLWLLIFGFIGARFYHVLNEWSFYRAHPDMILKVWNGGLAIHGAIIAGLITLWVVTQRQRLSFWLMADVLVIGLVIGQAIGRWGNYFNQELFGRPTELPWGIPIDPVNRPVAYQGRDFFHPTFLYESLGSLLIFGALWWLHRRRQQHRAPGWWSADGTIAITYVLLYSLLRIGTELVRIDRTPVISGLRLPIIGSLLFIILAIAAWKHLSSRPHGHT